MKVIDFNIKVRNLKGDDIEDFNVREAVANILAMGTSKSPIRTVELARKIFTDGRVELLKEDEVLLRDALEKSVRITDLAKATILQLFEP